MEAGRMWRQVPYHAALIEGIGSLVLASMVTLALVACVHSPGQNAGNPEALEISLKAALNDSIYLQGAPITVTTTFSIYGDGNVEVDGGAVNPLQTYRIDLFNEQDKPVPLTDKGMRQQYGGITHHISSILHADFFWQESFRLDDLFDLSPPGVYTLTLTMRVWTAGAQHDLVTDPVTFTRLP